MAPVSVYRLGCSSFGVSVTYASPDYSSSAAVRSSFPSLSAPMATSPRLGVLPCGWDPAQGVAEPRAEKQQLQQRALFVKMKPVCASVPVSRLACPAALS